MFDPLACIKAVNTLQKYRKEQVLAVANEYFRVCASVVDDDAMVVLRLLFDTSDNHSFTLSLQSTSSTTYSDDVKGATYPPAPVDKKRVPLFPLVLLDDVPLFLVYGNPLERRWWGYDSETPVFLDDLKKNGRIRTTPLRPPSDPLGLFDKFAASDQWLFGKQYRMANDKFRHEPDENKKGREIIQLQLLRLVRRVLPKSNPYDASMRLNSPNTDPIYWDSDRIELAERVLQDPTQWQKLRTELAMRSLRWNPEQNEYRAN